MLCTIQYIRGSVVNKGDVYYAPLPTCTYTHLAGQFGTSKGSGPDDQWLITPLLPPFFPFSEPPPIKSETRFSQQGVPGSS